MGNASSDLTSADLDQSDREYMELQCSTVFNDAFVSKSIVLKEDKDLPAEKKVSNSRYQKLAEILTKTKETSGSTDITRIDEIEVFYLQFASLW